MKLFAVIITYYPDLERLQQNISAFVDDVDGIMIWDNTTTVQKDFLKDIIAQYPQIILASENENKGIAYGLNHAWLYARQHNYDAMLTMDQDSIFEDFSTYKDHVYRLWKSSGLSACGPLTLKVNVPKAKLETINHIITSGMMIPVMLLNVVDGYFKDFKVDGIDVELCYHLKKSGYKVFRDNECTLHQQYGEPQSKRYFGKTLHSPAYSPSRLYGIFRNHIIIWRKYNHPKSLLFHIFRVYFCNFVIKGIILIEDNKWLKLKSVARGIQDGFKYKIQ
ncbi:MAG: glycosyl transferase family 2 [Bacteroidota bacterium]|nr:glycosyl transferase family 2 [Bacteroidota bacterium]